MRHFLFVFLIFPFTASAQSGPGGVGDASSNFLWLSADHGVIAPTAGVSQWSDRSGNGNHATQTVAARQPFVSPTGFNGDPAITFDDNTSNSDYLRIPDNSTLEGMNGLTGFAVFDLFDGTHLTAPRGILSKRNSPTAQNAYAWFLWGNGSNLAQHLDIDGTNNRINSSDTHSTGTVYLNGFMYHGAAPSNSMDQVLYAGNTTVGNGVETSTSIPNYSSDLYIGSLYGHTGSGVGTTRFNGRIAEVILYNTALNEVQRIIVSNYLSAKYGTSLGTSDVYTMDDPANGNYDHDVAGIGRISATVLHADAQGTGIVRINNPSNLGNNEYLLWGHDGGALGAWGVADYPAGLEGRLERVWRVSEVNSSRASVDVGAVDMTFDLSDLGSVDVTELRLLVDQNNDGAFANDSPIAGATALGGGLYRFSGVTALVNGRRFTLGTTNMDYTPLPVELLSFTAQPEENGSVRLDWSTASENNSDHFAVERSADADRWQPVSTIPAAGSSTTLKSYSTHDHEALRGTSFYRLQQIDLDGSSVTSPVVAVHRGMGKGSIQIHPVPFSDQVWIHSPDTEVLAVDLVDAAGRSVAAPTERHGESWQIATAQLPFGLYLVRVLTAQGQSSHTVLKAE